METCLTLRCSREPIRLAVGQARVGRVGERNWMKESAVELFNEISEQQPEGK